MPVLRPRPFRRRRRGQALIEVAVLLPLLVGSAFLVLAVWLQFNRVSAYTRAASTLAEWVGRTGVYDPGVMCPAIRQVLIDQVGTGVNIDCAGTGATNTFVQIVVLSPACLAAAGTCTTSGGEAATVVTVGGPYDENLSAEAAANLSACGTEAAGAVCPAGGIGWTGELPAGAGSLAAGSRVVVDIWGARRSSGILLLNNPVVWLLPTGHAVSYVTADAAL